MLRIEDPEIAAHRWKNKLNNHLPSGRGVRTGVLLTLLLALSCPLATADRKPLLQPNKQTLHQRVLTRPGATLVPRPGASKGKPQPAFSRFYVYGQAQEAGKEWIEVGVDTRGNTVGWLPADMTAPWRQQLALAFSNPAGRQRILFFNAKEDLRKVLESDTPGKLAAPLRETVVNNGRDPKIVSIEPKDYVDINKNFYL